MPDKQTMHDWREMVRERLWACGLSPTQREQTISELAAHLEETYEAARSHGLTETEAGLWAFWIPASALLEHNAFVLRHPLYYALGIFVWVVPPGIALLLGAAPFLKEQKLHQA